MLGQEELLEDEPDLPGSQPREVAIAQPCGVGATDPDDAARGHLQRAHHVQERGLTATGGAHDRHQLARPDREGHAAESGHGRLLAIDLGDRVQFQYRIDAHNDGTTT